MTGWEKKMSDLSNPQKIILFVISVIFLLLVWNMIPIPTTLKIILYVFLTPLTLALVFSVPYVLEYIDLLDSFSQSLIPILVVFLVIPLSLNLVVLFRHDDYIASLPEPEKIDLLVSCDVDCTKDSGVGNEWGYSHEINGSRFKNNDVVNADIDNLLTFKTIITEYDDIDDVGTCSTTHSDNTGLYDYNYTKKVIHKVTVKERGGKRNYGASADFIVTYTIQRKPHNLFKLDIIPIEIQLAPVGFWTLLFFTNNVAEVILISYLLLCEALFVVFIIIEGINSKQVNENHILTLLGRIIVVVLIPLIVAVAALLIPLYLVFLLIESFVIWLKDVFKIDRTMTQLKNSIVEVENQLKLIQEIRNRKPPQPFSINIPEGYTVGKDGYPKEKNSNKWGDSLTVYVTPHGNKWHRVKNCCGATIEKNIASYYTFYSYNYLKRYNYMCSKCGSGYVSPNLQWYYNYKQNAINKSNFESKLKCDYNNATDELKKSICIMQNHYKKCTDKRIKKIIDLFPKKRKCFSDLHDLYKKVELLYKNIMKPTTTPLVNLHQTQQ